MYTTHRGLTYESFVCRGDYEIHKLLRSLGVFKLKTVKRVFPVNRYRSL